MKRKVLVAMMASMILGLSGCGSQEVNINTSGNSSGNSSTQETVNSEAGGTNDSNQTTGSGAEEGAGQNTGSGTEQSTNQTTSSDVAGGSNQTTTSGYLDVTINYEYDSLYDEIALMYGHYSTIQLESDQYPALTSAVNAYNEALATESQKYFDELKEYAADEYKEYGADMFMGPYEFESDTYIRRADTQVLSAVEKCYSYEGGAHGNNYFNSVNFDVQTGAEIAMESVIKDKDSLTGILATEVKEKYPDTVFWSEDLEGLIKDYLTPSEEYGTEPVWTVDYEGVTFYFHDYTLSSYVEGVQQVLVSYSEYPQIFDSKYFNNVAKDYVIPLNDSNICSDIDLTGDGTTDYISVKRNYNAEYEMCESFDVTVNGNTYTLGYYYFDIGTYFVKAGENNYLYVQRRAESDLQTVSVFKITENSVEYVGDFANSLEGFTNSSDFKVGKRMDLLSTYFAIADCSIGEDGMPVEKNNVYSINAEISITSTVDITADLVDENGNLSGTSNTFPAGTSFQFIATDGETYVDMLASDGKRCRFYTTPDWPATVNGMDAVNSFEMLWYAG